MKTVIVINPRRFQVVYPATIKPVFLPFSQVFCLGCKVMERLEVMNSRRDAAPGFAPIDYVYPEESLPSHVGVRREAMEPIDSWWFANDGLPSRNQWNRSRCYKATKRARGIYHGPRANKWAKFFNNLELSRA